MDAATWCRQLFLDCSQQDQLTLSLSLSLFRPQTAFCTDFFFATADQPSKEPSTPLASSRSTGNPLFAFDSVLLDGWGLVLTLIKFSTAYFAFLDSSTNLLGLHSRAGEHTLPRPAP